MTPSSCLVVVRGFPYDEGTTLQLDQPSTILGRKDAQWEPDIGFDNVYVSRKQASITCEDGRFFLTDLDSKHGTSINGNKLTPFEPTALQSSDVISFAKGMISMAFSSKMWEETMDFIPLIQPSPASDDYLLDPVRQILLVQDQSYTFSEKEYRCLELLMRRERQFVGKDEVVRYVWPERADEESDPSATSEEINSLLYRIRKKTNHVLSIESIRGKGYILTLSRLAEKYV